MRDWRKLRPIIRMVCEGKTNREIGEATGYSRTSVERKLVRLYEFFGWTGPGEWNNPRHRLAVMWAQLEKVYANGHRGVTARAHCPNCTCHRRKSSRGPGATDKR